jgi:hypothetical protein
MNFKKFKILGTNEAEVHANYEVDILFNLNSIISIKPIRIALEDRLINGYWIRTVGGKKYKASQIPEELEALLHNSHTLTSDEEMLMSFEH